MSPGVMQSGVTMQVSACPFGSRRTFGTPRIHSFSRLMSSNGIGASSGIRPMPAPSGSFLVIHTISCALSGSCGSNCELSMTTRPFLITDSRMPTTVSNTSVFCSVNVE